MKIVEFRIILPIPVSKFPNAKHYMVHHYIRDTSGGGEGIEIVKDDEPFDNGTEKGYQTFKIYHVKSKIPAFIRWAVPDKYLHFHEHSLNCYPHCTTATTVPALGEDFVLNVESQHFAFKKGEQLPENIMNLSKEELAIRQIVYVDIVNGYPDNKHDLRNFVCPEAGIKTPLQEPQGYDPNSIPKWVENYDGEMMCCTKVVRFHLKWFGIQTAAEKLVAHTFYPKLFTESHRLIVATIKDWFSMTEEDFNKETERIKREQSEPNMFERDED